MTSRSIYCTRIFKGLWFNYRELHRPKWVLAISKQLIPLNKPDYFDIKFWISRKTNYIYAAQPLLPRVANEFRCVQASTEGPTLGLMKDLGGKYYKFKYFSLLLYCPLGAPKLCVLIFVRWFDVRPRGNHYPKSFQLQFWCNRSHSSSFRLLKFAVVRDNEGQFARSSWCKYELL